MKVDYDLEKIYEDEHIIHWRITWVWFGEHFEHWYVEEKRKGG